MSTSFKLEAIIVKHKCNLAIALTYWLNIKQFDSLVATFSGTTMVALYKSVVGTLNFDIKYIQVIIIEFHSLPMVVAVKH